MRHCQLNFAFRVPMENFYLYVQSRRRKALLRRAKVFRGNYSNQARRKKPVDNVWRADIHAEPVSRINATLNVASIEQQRVKIFSLISSFLRNYYAACVIFFQLLSNGGGLIAAARAFENSCGYADD